MTEEVGRRLIDGVWVTNVERQDGGGDVTPGTVVPVADTAGATVDTTTYDNTVVGSGKVTTLVFPSSPNDGDTVVVAVAIDGDDFPRWLLLSDPTDAMIYMGDGSFDAYDSGPHIAAAGGTLDLYPGSTGLIRLHGNDVTVPAPFESASAVQMQSVSSYLSTTEGALPKLGAWVSGTPKQNPNNQQITVVLEIVTDGTSNAATCAVAISPDDSTYTTMATPGVSATVNAVGAVTLMANVVLPQTWFIKLTLSHCTVAQSVIY